MKGITFGPVVPGATGDFGGMNMTIRPIRTTDYQAVTALLRTSFTATEHGYGQEAEIVTKIRQAAGYDPQLELVATDQAQIVAQGLLSPVDLETATTTVTGLVLAPLAVLPDFQGQGLGGAILQALEQRAQQQRWPFISILGHPTYYPRFGYQPASAFGIQAPMPVPDEAFMIKPLHPQALQNVAGTLHYPAAFD